MTLDDLIKRLEEIRDEHGGESLVWATSDGFYEQVRDFDDEVKYGYPHPDDGEFGNQEGVLIG